MNALKIIGKSVLILLMVLLRYFEPEQALAFRYLQLEHFPLVLLLHQLLARPLTISLLLSQLFWQLALIL